MRQVHPPAASKRNKGVKLPVLLTGLLAFAVLPFVAPTVGHSQENAGNSLASCRDKDRVLLVFAPSEKNATYEAQMKLWQGEKAGFEDRQLVVLPVLVTGKSGVSDNPAALAKRFDVDPKSFRVVLIGKDGHDAYQSKVPVEAKTLYHRIDAMPMRREEMKRQKTKD